MRKKWRGQLYATNYSAFARGAALWIKHGVPFDLLESKVDDQGRYILLKGPLDGTLIILGSIYAPNFDQDQFLQRLGLALTEWDGIPFMLGGDWNALLDVHMDRSHPPLQNTTVAKLTSAFFNWTIGWRLTDIWRQLHPTHKEYSHYSFVHSLHTRIDRFLCSTSLITQATHSTYLAKTFSDHCPLMLTLSWGRIPTPVPTWRLQPQLLEDAPYRATMLNTLVHYFRENWNTASSHLMEWDAMKSVVRGVSIGQVVGARHEIHNQLLRIEDSLTKLEREVTTDPTKKEALQEAHIEHAEVLETLRTIDYAAYTQRIHTEADKAGTLLARIVRDRPDPLPITHICASHDTLVHTQLEINTAFHDQLQLLYAAPPTIDDVQISEFMRELPIPKLPAAVADVIAGPITRDEIRLAIKSLNKNKTPGPDGLPIEFYQTYTETLTPYLEELYHTALQAGRLPSSTMEALVTVLPKPGRDALEISNYRPLSLLATEYKILSKSLATRIQAHLDSLIHIDQCGFLQNRSTSLNIRRLHHIMQATPSFYQRAGCLALDLRQAFDSLSWHFMFATLNSFGFPEGYIKLVRLLYTDPTARVRTGKYISAHYNIQRGTRQGCPLSPLLFVLTLEPLAIALRRSAEHLGIPIQGTPHLISIYADDILLYLRDLTADNSPLPAIFTAFKRISGLAINQNKSVAYPFTDCPDTPSLQFGTYSFPIESHTFKYLGVRIYKSQDDQIDGNIGIAVTALRSSVAFWTSLPLSTMGGVAISKMVVLPRLLYYFINLPVFIPLRIFTVLNTLLTTLIWGNQRKRISLSKLQLETHRGGLGAPDFKAYYYSGQFQWLSFWLAGRNLQEIGYTSTQLHQGTLHRLLLPGKNPKVTGPPLLQLAIRCWKGALTYTKSAVPYAPNIPLLGISTPQGRMTRTRLQLWEEKGITEVGTFFQDGMLMDHETFRQFTDAPARLYMTHAAVSRFIKQAWAPQRAEPTQHALVHLIYYMGNGKHLVRWLYRGIRTHASITLLPLKEKWTESTGMEISDKAWDQIIEHPKRVSLNA